MRCLYLAGLMIAAVIVTAAASAAAAAPRLKSRVVVSTEEVRVGDLFDSAGAAAGQVVDKSPGPGKRRMYDARRLLRIAHDARLRWRPQSQMVSTVVRRASREVGAEEVVAALRQAMLRDGADGELDIRLANRGTKLHVPVDRAVGFRISGLSYDLAMGRFTALAVVDGPDGPYERRRIAGRVYEIVRIPVLNRGMRPGEVIRSRDMGTRRVRARRLANGALTDPAAMIGLSPRRFLRPGVPVRGGDLRQPVLVAKGSTVTLSFRTPLMTLTAKGRATEDGARGETIRVINTRSRRTVEAVVAGPGVALVSGPGTDDLALRR